MQVSSPATTNFLNLGRTSHRRRRARRGHGLRSWPISRTSSRLAGGAVRQRAAPDRAGCSAACGLSLVDSIFNSDDSDLIVSATSQAGGLAGLAHVALSPTSRTWAATANPERDRSGEGAAQRAGRLEQLHRTPASRPASSATRPRRCLSAPAARAGRWRRSRAPWRPELTITSPAPGTSSPPASRCTSR